MSDETYKFSECIIAYTAGSGVTGEQRGRIKVGAWPDQDGWSKGFAHKIGACDDRVRQLDLEQSQKWLLQVFHRLVVRENVEPAFAHQELGQIDAYPYALFDPFMPPGVA